jgi:hypothetical protein
VKILKLSDEQRILLKTSAQHPQLVARAPKHLPAAACRAMVNRLIKRRLLIEVPALGDLAELAWRKNEKGKPLLLRLTDKGLRAIGIEPTTATSATVPTAARHCAPMVALKSERSSAQTAPQTERDKADRSSVCPYELADRLLAVWEEAAPPDAGECPIARVMEKLRVTLSSRTKHTTRRQPKPRSGTKQEMVLAMLRRPKGATIAQISKATGWLENTVRGFLGGLKLRYGIQVKAAKRIRQTGLSKRGAKGSYSTYHISD